MKTSIDARFYGALIVTIILIGVTLTAYLKGSMEAALYFGGLLTASFYAVMEKLPAKAQIARESRRPPPDGT